MHARTCLRFGAVSSIEVALRMLVESSVSDLLRSTFRVAFYAMLAGIEVVVVCYVEGWCRGLARRGSRWYDAGKQTSMVVASSRRRGKKSGIVCVASTVGQCQSNLLV